MKKLFGVLIFAVMLQGLSAAAQTPVNIGLRGGLGTDISGGLAYGIGGNYQLDIAGIVTELGINIYGSSSKAEKTTGPNKYTETTNLFVFGCLANYLINYSVSDPGLFFVGGVGLAAINVDWTESSPTDTSLGTPLPGGGSKQSVSALSAGSVINLGLGYLFAGGFDLRFEVPTILVFDAPGNSAAVVPTFTLTGGYRF